MTLNYIQLSERCDRIDRELGEVYLDVLDQVDTVNILKAENADKEVIICELRRQLRLKGMH